LQHLFSNVFPKYLGTNHNRARSSVLLNISQLTKRYTISHRTSQTSAQVSESITDTKIYKSGRNERHEMSEKQPLYSGLSSILRHSCVLHSNEKPRTQKDICVQKMQTIILNARKRGGIQELI
jgi:hypothetical protein